MADTSSNDSGFGGVFGNLSHSGSGCEDDRLYEQLWRLSAGPRVNIPSVGELVYYFPQGHMEMLEASTNQGVDQQMPLCNLPSQIGCRVLKTLLEAEHDEVYAAIDLIPEPQSSDAGGDQTPKSVPPAPKPKRKVQSFCMTLTASDCDTHGCLNIPRQHAVECLPSLDMSQESPTQVLVAQDLHGNKWCFKHIFRGTPKRHLFTTGWSDFVKAKNLLAGDTFIFLRGENGDLRVGVRRLMRQQSNMPPSLISTYQMHFMHLGVIAIASDAVSFGKMFTVVYNPRTSQSEFIIPCDKYMEAVNRNITVGMRFEMRFEEEHLERISTGTIIGIDIENPRWPNSKWRSLKVQWDKQSLISRPKRVSPWEIEPFVAPPSTMNGSSQASKFAAGDPSAGLNVSFLSSSQRDSSEKHTSNRNIATPKNSTVGGETFYAMLFQEEEDINTRRREGGLEPPIHHNNCGMDDRSTIKDNSPQSVTQVAETHTAQGKQEIEDYLDDSQGTHGSEVFAMDCDGKGDIEIPQQVGTTEDTEHKEEAVGAKLPLDVDMDYDS